MRPRLLFVLLATCALAWIGSSPDAFSQKRQQGLAANVVRSVHPILIRNQHGHCSATMCTFELPAPPGFEVVLVPLKSEDD